jgi:hypothetical protein
VSTAEAVPVPAHGKHHKKEHPLVNGHKIHGRLVQNLAWGTVVAAIGAAIIAGLYFNITQVHWYLPFGPEWLQHGFTLKSGWDSLNPFPRLGNWDLYRHGYRNDGEPALATLFVLVITASGAAAVDTKMSRTRVITGPFILLVLAFVLITGAIWLQFYGLPDAWHYLFGTFRIQGGHTSAKIWGVVETALFGAIVGRLLKTYWKPIAAHLQESVIDRMVDRYWARGGGTLPSWVRYPVAPPVMRECFSKIVTEDSESGEAEKLMAGSTTHATQGRHHKLIGVLLILGGLVVGYLTVSGLIAHFWIGAGHSFPYLAP